MFCFCCFGRLCNAFCLPFSAVCVLLTVSNQLQSLNDLSSSVVCLLRSSLFVLCLYADLNVESSSRCVRCGSSCVFLRSYMNFAESL